MNLSEMYSPHRTALFWVVFWIVVAATVVFVVFNSRGEDVRYAEMACTFEERGLDCLDSVAEWNAGLAYFDSSLSASGDALQSLKSLLWNFWDIEFAGAGEASVSREAVLPLQVLKNRKSGCVGLSWLAMMVAESRNLELYPILLPGHVFLRYGHDDGRGQVGFKVKYVNIEPNRRGYSYTDDEYREKYKNGKWTGLELKPLLPRQFMGLAAFDIGNLYLDGDLKRALSWYRLADELFPEYPGIRANQELAKSRLPDSF